MTRMGGLFFMTSPQALIRFARSGVRYSDLLVVTSYAGMGGLLAIDGWDRRVSERFILFSLCNYAFVASIYLFNDWSGWIQRPGEAEDRSHHAMKSDTFSQGDVFAILLLLGLVSTAGYALLDLRLFCIAMALQVVTLLYSHPKTNLKGIPGVCHAIHFLLPFLYCLGGWMAFAGCTQEGIWLALYMGLLPASAHFSHEVDHAEEDARAGIKTLTSLLGTKTAFRVGLALFILNSLFLVVLSARVLSLPGGVHLSWTVLAVWILQSWRYRGWKEGDSVSGFRWFYRWFYAGVFATLLGMQAWSVWLS